MAQPSSPSLPALAALNTPQLHLVILQIFTQLQHDRDFVKSENQMYKFHLSRAEDRLRKEQMRRVANEHQMNEQVGVFQAKTQAALEAAAEVQRLLRKAEQELTTAEEEAKKFKELSTKKDILLLKLKNELKLLEQKVHRTIKDTKVIQDISRSRSTTLQPSLEQTKEIEEKLLESRKKAINFQRLAEEREQQLKTADMKFEATQSQLQSAREEIKDLQAALLNASQNTASCEAKYEIRVEEVLHLKNSMKVDKELMTQTWVAGNVTVKSLQLALEAEKDRTREKEEKARIQMVEEKRRQDEKETTFFQVKQKLLQELEIEKNRSLSLQRSLDQNVFSGFANISALITTFGDKQAECETEKQQLANQLGEEKRTCQERISAMNQNMLTVLQEVKSIASKNQQTSEYIKVTVLTDLDRERASRSSLQSSCQSQITTQMESLKQALTSHHKNITESLDTYIIRPKDKLKKLPHILRGRPMKDVLLDAAKSGNVTELDVLLDAGANIESYDDRYNETPLLWAAEYGRLEACRLLLERGANIEARATGWKNRTPLHFAAINNRMDVIKLLVEMGADLTPKDSEGKTAAELGNDATKAWFSNRSG